MQESILQTFMLLIMAVKKIDKIEQIGIIKGAMPETEQLF